MNFLKAKTCLRRQGYQLKARFGFTLIELLVVISLVGMVMVTTVGLLFSVIRASRKSESLNQVKQAGSHTLELMSSMIRNAQELESCGASSVVFTNHDGGTTTLTCDDAADQISSNSAYLLSKTDAFSINLSDCAFSCPPSTGNAPDSVTIQFTLTLGETSDNQASATFNTTASLRNY